MKHLLIDANNLLYRAFYVTGLQDNKGNRTSGINGVMRMTKALIQKYNPDSVVIAWDLGKSKQRLEIYPEYKAQRSKNRKPEEQKQLQWSREYLQKIFGWLPVKQIMINNVEADDIIGWLCEKLKGKKIIISNDQDFIQLVGDQTVLYLPNRQKLLSKVNVDKFLGFPVQHYTLWKSLVGDTCLDGETKIKLLSGKSIKIKDMKSDSEYWVYSFDCKAKRVVPGKATCSKVTKQVKSLYRIKLDNGETILCTDNHPFLLSDGETYIRADKLPVGESLMPIYTRLANREYGYGKYEEIHQKFRTKHKRGKWELTHRMVAEHLTIKSKQKRGVHHIDHNSLNNTPDNLQWVSDSEHMKIHNLENNYDNVRKKWRDPEYRECMRKASVKVGKRTGARNITKYNKSPEKRLAESIRQKELARRGEHPSQKPVNRKKAADRCRKLGKRLAREKRSTFFQTDFHRKLNNDPKVKLAQGRGKIYKIYRTMLDHNLEFKDWENSLRVLKDKNLVCKNAISNPFSYFDSFDDIKHFNHRIVSIRQVRLRKERPVYDIKVRKYHNFALHSGVFVHNSDNIKGVHGIGPKKATAIILNGLKGKKKLPINSQEKQILDRNKYLIAIGALLTKKQLKEIRIAYVKEKNKFVGKDKNGQAKRPGYKLVKHEFLKMDFKELFTYFDQWKYPFEKLYKGNK